MSSKNLCHLALSIAIFLLACDKPAAVAPQDSATFDPDGTAHLTRVVPMPATISPEAQKWLESLNHSTPGPEDLATRRKRTDEWRAKQSAEALRLFPVTVESTKTAGVPTDILTPLVTSVLHNDSILINLHGGGFNSDSGSIKELLKTYKPNHIGIFGTSAGAILTAEVAVKLKQLNLPLPAALGLFSVLTDYSRPSDSLQLFTLNGFPGALQPQDPNKRLGDEYARDTDRHDPVLSPIFADLKGMPPTLLVTSTRDILLNDTSNFHRALLRSGVDARLVVFDALPHAFWYHFQLPETTEALNLMAHFFTAKLSH